ncbi:hypothetical protein [Legionella rowbothamii]|uniref:hypothetical protein n=1 Tax=Legionella rowbothamii TaxID=96229 RepID=UPI0013EF647E|nr:hypothetical protein [Legionella rowbothamii]
MTNFKKNKDKSPKKHASNKLLGLIDNIIDEKKKTHRATDKYDELIKLMESKEKFENI